MNFILRKKYAFLFTVVTFVLFVTYQNCGTRERAANPDDEVESQLAIATPTPTVSDADHTTTETTVQAEAVVTAESDLVLNPSLGEYPKPSYVFQSFTNDLPNEFIITNRSERILKNVMLSPEWDKRFFSIMDDECSKNELYPGKSCMFKIYFNAKTRGGYKGVVKIHYTNENPRSSKKTFLMLITGPEEHIR